MVGYCIHSFFSEDVRGVLAEIFRPRNSQIAAEVIPKTWLRLRKKYEGLFKVKKFGGNMQQLAEYRRFLPHTDQCLDIRKFLRQCGRNNPHGPSNIRHGMRNPSWLKQRKVSDNAIN